MRGLLVALMAGVALSLSGCFSFNKVSTFPFGEKKPLQAYTVGGDVDAREVVVFVEIQGIMLDIEERGLLGLTGLKNTVAHVRSVLGKAERDRDVRAVVLRINTPGGTVTAADLVYHEIMGFRERNPQIPVYAMMMDLATSGGYYAAVGADRIWAHPTTVTGSIGVIVQSINLAGLFEKIGVEDATVKSGRFKDVLSPLRPQSEEDRKVMQQVVDSLYENFLARVRRGRPNLDPGRLRELADGRIFAAEQAKAEGLIDEIGYFGDLLTALKARTGVPALRAVIYREEKQPDDNLYVAGAGQGAPDALLASSWAALLTGAAPGGSPFLYLWPGALGRPH